MPEPREAAARVGFMTVGANMGPIWVAKRLRHTVPVSRAGASISMVQHKG